MQIKEKIVSYKKSFIESLLPRISHLNKSYLESYDSMLFLLMVFIVFILFLIEAQLPVPSILRNTPIGQVLVDKRFVEVSSNLTLSLISAYVFYILIDFLPRKRKYEKTMVVLNSILASVFDNYRNSGIFSHEVHLTHVKLEALSVENITSEISTLRDKQIDEKELLRKLVKSTAVANIRIPDFEHTLSLTVNLSTDKALQWLVLTQKVRLLVEVNTDKYKKVNKINTETKLIGELKTRFIDFLNCTLIWLDSYPFDKNNESSDLNSK